MFGNLQRPTVLILGLGITGLAIARWCARWGCPLRIADTRTAPPNFVKLAAFDIDIDAGVVVGEFTPALLDGGIELIAISPGLSPFSSPCTSLIAAARARGIPLWGEFEFFARALDWLRHHHGYRPKVLAITGTNGKTTTTALTGLLCECAGKKVAVAGNIGVPVLDKLSDAIEIRKIGEIDTVESAATSGALLPDISDVTLPDIWVLEVSSFQLEMVETFAPDAAAVLNISEDHLDWHLTFDAYLAAKGRIFGPNTIRVLNREDTYARVFFANNTPTNAKTNAPVVTFGLNPPEQAGDYGLLLSQEAGAEMAWLGIAEKTSFVSATSGKPLKQAIKNKRLLPVDKLHIRGSHNAANAMAALALARTMDLPFSPLLRGLCEYRGEPHRVEWIATINGVDYVDDSKGTNVGATCAALNGLARRTILILGGDGKGQDFKPLIDPVARWCCAVMLVGCDAALIHTALAAAGAPMPIHVHTTLEDATHMAAAVALPGDLILLSPACASFDMFRDYGHRAEVFRQTVEALALAAADRR